jgi:hypothetical protein
MAVPDTSTFTLQDVVNEVNPTTDDLIDCFADAVASKFDSTYSGSKNQLLNFRNYGAVSLTQFSIDYSASYGNVPTACSLGNSSDLDNLWHDGSGTSPSVGDTIYQDSAGLYLFTGPNYWYIPNGGLVMQVNSSGVVTSLSTC